MEAVEAPAGYDAHCYSAACYRVLHWGMPLSPHSLVVLGGEEKRFRSPLLLSLNYSKTPSLLSEHLRHIISLAFLSCFVTSLFFFLPQWCVHLCVRACVCSYVRETELTSMGLQFIACYLLSMLLLCGLVIEPVCLEADIDFVIYLFFTFMRSALYILAFIRNHGYPVLLKPFQG